MTLSIHLLGRPLVRAPDPLPPPRGRKVWGLLAYLLLRHGPASREELASLLFADAEDPLGALRWNLAELRRLLENPGLLHGRHVHLELSAETYVDVQVVMSGTWVEAVEVPGLGRELLEGMTFAGCPAFEAWLLNERRHLQTAAEGVLREAALARLSAGREQAAIDLAARLVALNPLDEAYQELLIRAYAAAGDRQSAARQLSACIQLFRSELGVEPGNAVFSAAESAVGFPTAPPIAGRPAARAQLEAGQTAVSAGALEAGLQCIRRAAAEAHACGDVELKARALSALGSALVYAARGRDEEGAAALHEVITIAERAGNPSLAVPAYRELAALEALRGRYERAKVLLAKAAEMAADDGSAYASILAVVGAALIETGEYAEGMGQLEKSVQLAEGVGDLSMLASALSEKGRGHVLLGELAPARLALERACRLARDLRLTSLLPYPEALLGEVDLGEGNLEVATERLEHAFALGCQLDDPCYEGLAGRALGLLAEARGDYRQALTRLKDARRRCARSSDASLWILAYTIDALCVVGIRHGVPEREVWINELEGLAGRTGMRDLLVRAYLHREALGDRTALETAKLLCGQVSNPQLYQMLEAIGFSVTDHGGDSKDSRRRASRDVPTRGSGQQLEDLAWETVQVLGTP